MIKKVLLTLAVVSCIPLLNGCDESGADNTGYDNPYDTEEPIKLDKRLVMVEVSGLLNKRMPMAEVVSKYIETRYVDLNTGRFIAASDAPENYDEELAASDPQQSIALNKADDLAQIGRRENIGKLYLVHNDNGDVEKVIVPVRATGKNPTIYAFVSLNLSDLSIYKFGIYQHSETPALGGRFVDDEEIVQRFAGKSIFKAGKPDFHVLVKHDAPLDKYSIDGISGATMTSTGIQNAINYWCGDNAFGPAIRALKQ